MLKKNPALSAAYFSIKPFVFLLVFSIQSDPELGHPHAIVAYVDLSQDDAEQVIDAHAKVYLSLG